MFYLCNREAELQLGITLLGLSSKCIETSIFHQIPTHNCLAIAQLISYSFSINRKLPIYLKKNFTN